MIRTKVIQTVQRPFRAAYEVWMNKQIIGQAHIDKNTLGATIYYQQGQEEYQLQFDRKAGYRYYRILNSQGCEIGTMQRGEQKCGFLKPVYYYTLAELEGKTYHIYDIGMGKEGIYYPCYRKLSDEDELQVGMMHRDAVVIDMKENYECYMKEEEDILLLNLFAIYNDFWNFRRAGQVGTKTKQVEYFYTMNKKLKAKYDPDFLKNN